MVMMVRTLFSHNIALILKSCPIDDGWQDEEEDVLPVSSLPPYILPFPPELVDDNDLYISGLKARCDDLTAIYYADHLSPSLEGGHNQMEYYEAIKRNITWLLSCGFFLRGGFDENVFLLIHMLYIKSKIFVQGMTMNFSNPLIANICKGFYYNGREDCLAVLFPEEFQELPRKCLAMVCVYVCSLHLSPSCLCLLIEL
jgi:hypothetical protein